MAMPIARYAAFATAEEYGRRIIAASYGRHLARL
jgi:hypothetical protein